MPLVTISSKGQLVIPAEMRKKYKLRAGTRVAVVDEGGEIRVKPDPFDRLLALRGSLAYLKEDVEGWWIEEKKREREREEVKLREFL